MCAQTPPAKPEPTFVDVTRNAFRFLQQFGFQEVATEDSIVRYASNRVFLAVYHGRSSREIGLEIGVSDAAPSESRGHSMSALVRLANPEQAAQFRNTIAVTPEEVQEGVEKLASQLKAYGRSLLEGDMLAFAALAKQRREWAQVYAAEVAYRQVLPQADQAFRMHDYEKAAALYESIRSSLSPAELKKLQFAKRRGGP